MGNVHVLRVWYSPYRYVNTLDKNLFNKDHVTGALLKVITVIH